MERSYIASLLDGSLLGKIPLITMPMGESAAFSRTKDSCSGGMFSGADCFVGTAFKTENLAYKGHLYLINLSENKVTGSKTLPWIRDRIISKPMRSAMSGRWFSAAREIACTRNALI